MLRDSFSSSIAVSASAMVPNLRRRYLRRHTNNTSSWRYLVVAVIVVVVGVVAVVVVVVGVVAVVVVVAVARQTTLNPGATL